MGGVFYREGSGKGWGEQEGGVGRSGGSQDIGTGGAGIEMNELIKEVIRKRAVAAGAAESRNLGPEARGPREGGDAGGRAAPGRGPLDRVHQVRDVVVCATHRQIEHHAESLWCHGLHGYKLRSVKTCAGTG